MKNIEFIACLIKMLGKCIRVTDIMKILKDIIHLRKDMGARDIEGIRQMFTRKATGGEMDTGRVEGIKIQGTRYQEIKARGDNKVVFNVVLS